MTWRKFLLLLSLLLLCWKLYASLKNLENFAKKFFSRMDYVSINFIFILVFPPPYIFFSFLDASIVSL